MFFEILSIPLLAFALYILLEKLKIFHSKTIHAFISIGIAFLTYPVVQIISPLIGAGSIFFICEEKIKKDKGIIVGISLALAYFILALLT